MSDKSRNLLLSILPIVITGAICSYFTRSGIASWYGSMNTSSLTPPNFVFSISWSIIYILLIVSFYRILEKPNPNKAYAIRLYWQQLIIQVLWCILFFGMKLPLVGGLVILWLIWTVFKMLKAFAKIDKTAVWLNIYYLLYICFAAFLNWSFLYANNLIKTL